MVKTNGELVNDVTYLRNSLVIANPSFDYLEKEFFTNLRYEQIKNGYYSCYKKIHFIITDSIRYEGGFLDKSCYISILDTIIKIVSYLSNNKIRFCFHFPYSLYKEYDAAGYINRLSELKNITIVRHKDCYSLLFKDGHYKIKFEISKITFINGPYLKYKIQYETQCKSSTNVN